MKHNIYKNVIEGFKNFTIRHTWIQSYGTGSFLKVDTREFKYPLVWFQPKSFRTNVSELALQFTVLILDKQTIGYVDDTVTDDLHSTNTTSTPFAAGSKTKINNDSKTNLVSISNTNLDVALDFLRYFDLQRFNENGFYCNLTSANYVEEYHTENLQGWVLEIDVLTQVDLSYCDIIPLKE